MQNIGIPLHNLTMTLSFSEKSGAGRFSIPLKASEKSPLREGQFAKGMMTDFFLKSHQLEEGDVAFLAQLEDATRQAASISLFADGFFAWEYRLDSLWTPAKERWNRLAWRLTSLLERQKGTNAEGVPIVKSHKLLPAFIVPPRGVKEFIKCMRGLHRHRT